MIRPYCLFPADILRTKINKISDLTNSFDMILIFLRDSHFTSFKVILYF
jgi:hypothetical protein